ncbi:hypothetical protein CC1G_14697 [Coprinopsis cinerea okayama7|uniref:Uncharacterized protein n=1 Tax=Coprinopsis cinerea (strain Okayama-7 / 130 / ATCC MYA-4618 / FGSC 9003) TaxID=240176 RepID=D6RML1_COPC7|nr:hypothetical protein CC1G_14697 [Coprinopsis cinerea okayama7\|eukprot:XP_002911268.1 hypothetical protein CC1G_14697 [Coprinopsis cinerea okayama7\
MGDKHCFIIPVNSRGPFEPRQQRYLGPTFEVADQTTGIVAQPAYLRIGEPLVLSRAART